MWLLLKLYWKKNHIILGKAFLVSMVLMFFPTMRMTMYGMGGLFIGLFLFASELHVHALVRTLITAIGLSLMMIFAPLMVAALESGVGLVLFTGFMFLLLAEVFITFTLGRVFSPIRLIFNPRVRLEALRPVLEEHVISADRYVNILNELTGPDSETNSFYAKPLMGSEQEMAELVCREQQAIAQLPDALQAVHAEVNTREFLPERGLNRETSLIQQKKEMYQTYRNQLTPLQQGHFDAYLDASLGLTHAICATTQASLLDENPDEFFILEKQYRTQRGWQAVPQQTHVFYNDPAEKDILVSLVKYERRQLRWTIIHPLHRGEQLFWPITHPNPLRPGEFNETRYRRYAYHKIAQHPVSLQVCEAIETFNHSMQVEPTVAVAAARANDVRPELAVANQPSGAGKKRRAEAVPSGVTIRNIYSESGRQKSQTGYTSSSEKDNLLEFSSESDEDNDCRTESGYTV